MLRGHTHGVGVARSLENLVVHTGGAECRAPKAQDVLLVD